MYYTLLNKERNTYIFMRLYDENFKKNIAILLRINLQSFFVSLMFFAIFSIGRCKKWIKRKSARAVFNHYFALILLF